MRTSTTYHLSAVRSSLSRITADQGLFVQFMFAVILLLATTVLQVSVHALERDARAPGTPQPGLPEVQQASMYGGAVPVEEKTALRIFQSNRPRFEVRNLRAAYGTAAIMDISTSFHQPQRQVQQDQSILPLYAITSPHTGRDAETHVH